MKRILLIVLTFISVLFLANVSVSAYNPQDEVVSITLTTYFDEQNQVNTTLSNIPYGNKLVLKNSLGSTDGYDFVFWMVNGVIDNDFLESDEFTLTGDQNITAVYKPTGKVVAVFVDTNGDVLDIQYIVPGNDATDLDELSLPSKPGYVISDSKWNHSLTNIQEDTLFVLQYTEATSNTYQVSVTNGTGAGTYDYNTVATVIANKPATSSYFWYWRVGEEIVSYQSSYSFTVFANTTLEAIYGDYELDETPLISISDPLSLRTGYNSYLGHIELPIGFTLVEHGVLTSNSDEVLLIDTVDVVKNKSQNLTADTSEFLVSIDSTTVVSARAYMIVEDGNGNYMTIYSENESSASVVVYADDLFFSFYMEGSSNNKAFSIYNGTGNDVDLSEYSVKLYNNGNTDPNSTLNLSGTLANGDVYVIANSSANTTILAIADTTNGVANYNGDDALTLEHNGTVIDSIGQVGTDPGTAWSNNDVSTLDHSLRRIDTTTSGDSNPSDAYDPSIYWISDVIDSTEGIDTFTMDGSGPTKSIIGFDAYIEDTTYDALSELTINNSYLKVYYSDGSASIEALTTDMITGFDSNTVGDFSLTVTYEGFTDTLLYDIIKIDPSYNVPEIGIVMDNGSYLYDLSLPSGFSWEGSNDLLTLGTHTYTVTYTPDDTSIYNIITGIEVSFDVVEEYTPIIIYEVYGGGGNTAAIYNQDYIVLYNNSPDDIDISGYSVQYASTSDYTVINLSGTIYSNTYYVVGLLDGANGKDLDINPNVVSTVNLNSTSARIALVSNQEVILDMTDIDVVDFVGYGSSALEYETAPTGNLSNVLSAKRTSFNDTDDNSSDFALVTPDLDYIAQTLSVTSFDIQNLKSYYEIDDTLDVSSSRMHVYYSNGSSGYIDITTAMVSNFNTSTLGDYTLTVTYSGISVDYSYHVIDYSTLDAVNINYIDIGLLGGPPGEATLIQIGGIDILVDSGDDDSDSQTALLNYLSTAVTDGTIEYIIATHPHADHIGGFIDVMDNYVVENVIEYATDESYTSALKINYEQRVDTEGATVISILDLAGTANDVITLIPGVTMTFYDDNFLQSDDPNASSIIFVLDAFGTRVLFNGDAEGDQEAVYASLVGDVDVIKMGHHGSAAGTTTYLLEQTTPEAVVVSNGDFLGNEYSHPTYTALSNVYNYSNVLPVYSVTGGNGDGSDITLERNGTITLDISSSGYTITSENYGYNPIEVSNTTYWDTINTNSISGYYYSSATGLTDATLLKAALHEIINDHTSVGYSLVDENLQYTDEDPNNTDNVILFYTGRSDAKTNFGAADNQWNREHIWANSHGIDDAEPAYSDLHHLRPTDVVVNRNRGNLDFSDVDHISSNYVYDYSGTLVDGLYSDGTYYEVRDSIKGDVARMLLYMTVRYEGDRTNEPDLELVDGTTTTDSSNLGNLSAILQWYLSDPVDQTEITRNGRVYEIQGNRNPFIDFPQFIYVLYGDDI